MDADEQVTALFIGNHRPLLQRNECVIGARVDDFHP